MDNIILILGLILVLGLVILFLRLIHLLFMPSFYRYYSKVGQRKIESLLQEKGFEFVNGRDVLNRKAKSLGYQKSFLEKISFRVIHFQFVEGFNKKEGNSEYFWIKGSKIVWFQYLLKTKAEIFREFDSDIVKSLKTWQFNEEQDIKAVSTHCPACYNKVESSDANCPDCGLVFL